MTPENYNDMKAWQRRQKRQEYINHQKGLCYYCKASLDAPAASDVRRKRVNKRLFPKGFFMYPVHLDHDHDTGMTRGAVHAICNAVLWQYEGK